ncbi:hypothetical protein INR75_04910 [Zunongwangia sp. SCSIO 43204]|uniref:hypothetical protein n=1 Tax=Zunongwangia sp. SCSIO 43204 TaxID=2779359 RepID=UPI001CA862A7|nr:hypothetical protein [Zunongwangia sp. SCSIO 43204]UAB85363.1 hypothetical protein INR75_04910 [Zunongwangia sp. SCSIO 43204]
MNADFENASFRYIPANDYAQPDSGIRLLDHSLALSIAYAESFKYQIQAEGFNPIEIDFSTIRKNLPCNVSLYLPNQASSNGEVLNIIEIPPIQFLVVVALNK